MAQTDCVPMEAVALKLPDSLEADELLYMPATWADYLDVVDTVPYTVQFLNNELIMSQASGDHETLVGVLIWLLNNHYIAHADYQVMGSSVKIIIPGDYGDVNADACVVKSPIYGLTPTGKTSNSRLINPEIVVEVLSKSTRRFDLQEKLTYYKLIPPLQHVLFVDQYRPYATVYSRTNVPDEWLNHDYRTLDSTVRLGDLELPMSAIYRKTVFE
ncbi:Uma2 family endonuclease [Fibrella sp. HMF5335]|uniref:Uma2 family endonuclease n=1 Tax=Fibrella rubiginis TaxID=2817060 RepID=A0A939K5J8_9BACT|nr:Uma2 family endonuclease [Fibrella rubiginis]MBO0937838.1 Uma2 family endonuclease [Fibrella rubiginis]